MQKSVMKPRIKDKNSGRFVKTHGLIHTRAYRVWAGMKQRVLNPSAESYQYYGGRGIKVCERWLRSFEHFLSDMGHPPDGLTLDRVNNDGDYEPDNCRWATPTEQNNTRGNNRLISFQSKTQTISQWAHELDINVITLFNRFNRGWSVERALLTPINAYFGGKKR